MARKGVEQKLVERPLAIPAKGVWLQVYAGKGPAIDLYRKTGFELETSVYLFIRSPME